MKQDKFLTEQMGECWHEWNGQSSGLTCNNCGMRVAYHTNSPKNPDFATWTGFGKLWEWAKGQEWWWGFIDDCIPNPDWNNILPNLYPILNLINPDNLANALYEFLKEKTK